MRPVTIDLCPWSASEFLRRNRHIDIDAKNTPYRHALLLEYLASHDTMMFHVDREIPPNKVPALFVNTPEGRGYFMTLPISDGEYVTYDYFHRSKYEILYSEIIPALWIARHVTGQVPSRRIYTPMT